MRGTESGKHLGFAQVGGGAEVCGGTKSAASHTKISPDLENYFGRGPILRKTRKNSVPLPVEAP